MHVYRITFFECLKCKYAKYAKENEKRFARPGSYNTCMISNAVFRYHIRIFSGYRCYQHLTFTLLLYTQFSVCSSVHHQRFYVHKFSG